MHVVSKDVTLERMSIIFLTLGFSVLAAASSLWVAMIGKFMTQQTFLLRLYLFHS